MCAVVCATKYEMEPADFLDLPCELTLIQEIAPITERYPHVLQIAQHGFSMGIDADLDGAGTVGRFFPRVYLRHFLSPRFSRFNASPEL
jgi:hypothetical protein